MHIFNDRCSGNLNVSSHRENSLPTGDIQCTTSTNKSSNINETSRCSHVFSDVRYKLHSPNRETLLTLAVDAALIGLGQQRLMPIGNVLYLLYKQNKRL